MEYRVVESYDGSLSAPLNLDSCIIRRAVSVSSSCAVEGGLYSRGYQARKRFFPPGGVDGIIHISVVQPKDFSLLTAVGYAPVLEPGEERTSTYSLPPGWR